MKTVPAYGGGVWNEMTFKVLSNTTHFMIL